MQHQIRVPQRVRFGPSKGELVWRRPNRTTLSNLLHHPIYAGAYTYGRRPTDPKRKQPGRPSTGRLVAKTEECQVLLPDRLPAYIRWEQFERNRRQLEANPQAGLGVIRYRPSLLSGLVVCGRCGLRMASAYNNNGDGLRYSCTRVANARPCVVSRVISSPCGTPRRQPPQTARRLFGNWSSAWW